MRIDLDDNTEGDAGQGDAGLIIRSESASRRKRRGPTPAQLRRAENTRIVALVVVIFASLIGFMLYQLAEKKKQGSNTLDVTTPKQVTVGKPSGPTVVPGGAGPMAQPGQRRTETQRQSGFRQAPAVAGPPDDGVGEGRKAPEAASEGME